MWERGTYWWWEPEVAGSIPRQGNSFLLKMGEGEVTVGGLGVIPNGYEGKPASESHIKKPLN